MKKFLISIIAGAVLVGIGVGVLFFEMAQFTVEPYLPYIKEDKIDTFSFKDEEIFKNNDNSPININVYLGEYFDEHGDVKVVESPYVDGIELEIAYHGVKPRFYFNNYYGEAGIISTDFGLSCHQENWLPKEILDVAKYMCQNKVFVEDVSNFYVTQVVVKTSNPDLVKVVK